MIKILGFSALAIFCIGLLFRFHSIARKGRVFKKDTDTWASQIIGFNYLVFLFNTLVQVRLFRAGKIRWLNHGLVVVGFIYLLLIHGLDDWSNGLFASYQPGVEPFRFLRNLAGCMVVIGAIGFLARRLSRSRINRERQRRDRRFWVRGTLSILVILGLVSTGFLTEALQIMSEPRFSEMVEDYSDLDGEPELIDLRAYWAKYYNVSFNPQSLSPAQGQIVYDFALGQELNQDYCLECHTRPDTAFVSAPLARMAGFLGGFAAEFRLDRFFYWFHLVLALILLCFLPFSRMFHLLAIPIASARKRIGPGQLKREMGYLDLVGLSACTNCGLCSQVCSVYPDYQVTENPQILPHVKIDTLKNFAGKGVWDIVTLTRLRSGNDDCTLCGRCADVCPSGIDLIRLWTSASLLMDNLGCPDTHTAAMAASFGQWTNGQGRGVNGKQASESTDTVDGGVLPNLAGQADAFEHCVQCTLCTNACPVVAYDLNQNDLGPHQVMNLLRLGEQHMASGSQMVWHCLTCYSCQEVCPQSIRVTDILLELRSRGQVRAGQLIHSQLRGDRA